MTINIENMINEGSTTSLTKTENDFLELIAKEIASNCKSTDDANIDIEKIQRAHEAIKERMWKMLNDDQVRRKVSKLLGATVWKKINHSEISKKANDSCVQFLKCEQ
jgi:hypothetical protein